MLVSTCVQSSIEAHRAFDPKHTASKANRSWLGPRYGTTAFVLLSKTYSRDHPEHHRLLKPANNLGRVVGGEAREMRRMEAFHDASGFALLGSTRFRTTV